MDADQWEGLRAAIRRPSQNTPFQPEYRRPPRHENPEKWGRTPYADRTGDKAADRLTPKKRKKKSP